MVTDFPCLERGSFDLAYLTEVDPLWNDDELTLILNPEAVLFANPVAVAACAADCVAATAGFGIAEMFWCAGCQGGLYLLDGHAHHAAIDQVVEADLLTHMYGTPIKVAHTLQGDLYMRSSE